MAGTPPAGAPPDRRPKMQRESPMLATTMLCPRTSATTAVLPLKRVSTLESGGMGAGLGEEMYAGGW